MRLVLGLTALLLSAVLIPGADAPSAVSFFDHQKVSDTCAKSGNLLTSADLRVLCNHRAEPAEPEIHEKTTHVFSIVDGTAVMVTGGKLMGAKVIGPGETRGSNIDGGQTHRMTKGDVIVIPAGTPHWWKEVQSMSYYGVNILKP